MDERTADNEVYEDARGELPTEEHSNDEFEDVQSEQFNEKFNENANRKAKSSKQVQRDGENEPNKPDEELKQAGESSTDDERTPNEQEPADELTEEELKEKLARSTELKDQGNAHFKNQAYDESLELYTKALAECPNRFGDKKAIILNNKAVCRWRLLERSSDSLNFADEQVKTEFEAIIDDLSKAIELNPSYFKPYLKRAEFNHRFGGDKLDNSLEDYRKVLEMLPAENRKLSDEVKYEIAKLEKEIEERNEKLKQEMFAQLKNLGNLCLRPFGLSTDNFKLQQNENGGYSVNFQQ